MAEVDQRVSLAAEYLAEVRRASVEQLPPTVLARECPELRRLLGQVLAVLAGRQDESQQLDRSAARLMLHARQAAAEMALEGRPGRSR